MIDYRDLLIKYINHVDMNEGVSFLDRRDWFGDTYFSEEEWAELQELDKIYLDPEKCL